MPRSIRVQMAAPIPVGHEIEFVALERNLGVFGDSWTRAPLTPRVTDLTTGIHYVPSWYADLTKGQEFVRSARVREGERLQGKVASCSVVIDADGKLDAFWTFFVVE